MNALKLTFRPVTIVALLLWGCGPGDIFDRGDVVASVDGSDLSVEALASIVAGAEGLPVTRDIVERLTHRWVEYSLFAQRLAAGDSLMSDDLIQKTMWPEIEQDLVESFHRELVADNVQIDDGEVDSIFDAGEYRLIDHILVSVDETAGAEERQRARREAERIRAQAVAGASWARLNELSDDPGARRNGGSLGVIRRGQMAPSFEEAAFDLQAGAISPVVETSFGYHVIRRRAFDEVRDEYMAGVRAAIEEDFTMQFLEELVEAWGITLEEDALAVMREAAGAPLRLLDSRTVIGRYRGGEFTVADFVRWLQVLPLRQQALVGSAGEEALERMASSMIRNEVLLLEAKAADVDVDEETMTDVRRRYAADVARVRSALQLSDVMDSEMSAEARMQWVDDVVLAYLHELVANLDDVVVVPAFLGAALRQEGEWVISERGLDRTVARAQEARLAMSLERRGPQ